MTVSAVRSLSGLREIASEYDAFFVDLWGVVHDGNRPFDGVPHVLEELSAAGRQVIFVTNSSRSGALVTEMLSSMGIPRELYEGVVSSGDVTRAALVARDQAVFGRLPGEPRCFHTGDAAFVPWLFELGLTFVEELAEADLIVATGTVSGDAALEREARQLAPAATRGVPLVCTNPDRVIPTAAGLTLGPGAVAAAYAELGAEVFLYGKPHAPIYAAATRLIEDRARARVVAVGDLLDTDIQGARGAGIASVLVTETGGHARALGEAPTRATLDALFASAGVTPDFVLARFAW